MIPVAILGSDNINVYDIDVESLSLQGLGVKMAGKSKKYLAHYEDVNGDEYIDIILQFEDSDSWMILENAEAKLTGKLLEGTAIQGSDTICIVP